jgi:hypothetical protein
MCEGEDIRVDWDEPFVLAGFQTKQVEIYVKFHYACFPNRVLRGYGCASPLKYGIISSK